MSMASCGYFFWCFFVQGRQNARNAGPGRTKYLCDPRPLAASITTCALVFFCQEKVPFTLIVGLHGCSPQHPLPSPPPAKYCLACAWYRNGNLSCVFKMLECYARIWPLLHHLQSRRYSCWCCSFSNSLNLQVVSSFLCVVVLFYVWFLLLSLFAQNICRVRMF